MNTKITYCDSIRILQILKYNSKTNKLLKDNIEMVTSLYLISSY